MTLQIDNEIFTDYLKCEYKAYLKLKGNRGQKTQFEKLQNRLLVEYRIRGGEHLLSSKYKNEDVPADISPSESTFQQCRMAINVTAVASPFSASIDAVAVSSSSTPAQYIPVQFVPKESVSKDEKLLLSFWGSLLGKKFGRLPAFGRIFHGENFRSVKVNLHHLIPKAGHVMEKIVALSESNDGPALLINKYCQTCEFEVACRLTALENDDLSLLPSLKQKDIAKLNDRGIFTVTQYSYTFRPRRKRKRPEHYRNPHRPELKALAIRENKVYVHGTPELPQSKVDIYVDVEGIPDSCYYYLIGLLIVDRGCHREHSLWANGPDEQLDIFRSFLNLVSGYEDYTIYHYGRYERDYLKRMAKNLDNKTAETTKNLMDRCCNLLSYFHSEIYLPTYSNGLKAVANLLGFSWTDPRASGIQSIVWRKQWELDASEVLKNKLKQYNMEDCRALVKVREFIDTLKPDEASAIAENNIPDVVFCEALKPASRFKFLTGEYALPEIEAIHK